MDKSNISIQIWFAFFPSPLLEKVLQQLYILWPPLAFQFMKLAGLCSLSCRLRGSGLLKCFLMLTLYFVK